MEKEKRSAMNKNRSLSAYYPPGYKDQVLIYFLILASLLLIQAGSLYPTWLELQELKQTLTDVNALILTSEKYFDSIPSLLGLTLSRNLTILLMLYAAFDFYQYLKGSQAAYVLKRTGRRFDMELRCFTLPLVGAIIAIAEYVLLVIFFTGVYRQLYLMS